MRTYLKNNDFDTLAEAQGLSVDQMNKKGYWRESQKNSKNGIVKQFLLTQENNEHFAEVSNLVKAIDNGKLQFEIDGKMREVYLYGRTLKDS